MPTVYILAKDYGNQLSENEKVRELLEKTQFWGEESNFDKSDTKMKNPKRSLNRYVNNIINQSYIQKF